jgi:hypothetical protein
MGFHFFLNFSVKNKNSMITCIGNFMSRAEKQQLEWAIGKL